MQETGGKEKSTNFKDSALFALLIDAPKSAKLAIASVNINSPKEGAGYILYSFSPAAKYIRVFLKYAHICVYALYAQSKMIV